MDVIPAEPISERLALLPEDPNAVIDADFANGVQAAVESYREQFHAAAFPHIPSTSAGFDSASLAPTPLKL